MRTRWPKKLQAQIQAESFRETEAFLQLARQRLTREKALDTSSPQWLEEGLRAALHHDARRLLQQLFSDPDLFPDQEPARPKEKRYGPRPLLIQTLFGPVEVRRHYYHHAPSHHGRCPLDEKLGLVESFSPALARLVAHASARSASYQEAARDLHLYACVELETRAFDRLVQEVAPTLAEALESLPPAPGASPIPIFYVSADGTGVPMRREELVGRSGRQADGSAKTREAKLGCVFTQTVTDEEGGPLRDPDSTSYVGTFGGASDLGLLLRQEAKRRGLDRAQQVVFLGDGAAWVWEIARLQFPGAIQILDFYHASEYVAELAALVFPTDVNTRLEHRQRWTQQMKESSPKQMLEEIRTLLAAGGLAAESAEQIQSKIGYFENQAERTCYGELRAKGYFIGSGVIEAGCKTVVGRRLKQSGMFWSQSGAENLLRLRCLILGPHEATTWAARPRVLARRRAKARRWMPTRSDAPSQP